MAKTSAGLKKPETTSGSAAAVSERDLPALRRRVTGVLVAGQVLGGLGVATGIALAAVLAQEIGGSAALSGLAPTAVVAGTALGSAPLGALMNRYGRRAGLVVAYLCGSAGAAVVVAAAALGSFTLLLVGMAGFGVASAANLQARFAAADLAARERRGRAIAVVVWATTVGAVIGPNVSAPAGRSVTPLGLPAAAGPFLWAAVVFLVAAGVIGVLLRPDPLLTARALAPVEPAAESRNPRAALLANAGSSRARFALAALAVTHTVMVAVMAMTPVHLAGHGAGIELIGLVISGHVAGMYAFAPVMGRLSDTLGPLPVIALGMALLAAAALLAGTAGPNHVQSAAGLFVLGLGWSAGIVAGSALLTDSVPEHARASVQGLSDLVMSVVAGVGGALAGLVVAVGGYGALNLISACLLIPLAVAHAALVRRREAQ